MKRRDFLRTAAALSGGLLCDHRLAAADPQTPMCRTYASPRDATKSPRETELFATALRVGIDSKRNDYLAVVDVDPQSL